jgi:hypothetical protein
MEYKHSEEMQKIVNKFFGKENNGSRPKLNNYEAFDDVSDTVLRPEWSGDTEKFHGGFDLGVKYAQERFDAKLNGKPLPELWIAFAPETNHFFVGTEKQVIEKLTEAAKNLELESCVCSAMMLFTHGCQCSNK